MRKIVLLVLFLSMVSLRAEAAKKQDTSDLLKSQDLQIPIEDVSAILKKLEDPFKSMTSISYKAKREREAVNGEMKDSWLFVFRNPTDVRIEYKSPQRRRIIINKSAMWEYLPDNLAVMHTDLSKKTQAEKENLVFGVLARVSISGMRPGDYSHLLANITFVEKSGNILTVKGDKSPRFMFKIDIEKNVMLASELYDNDGKLKLRTISTKHKEVDKDFWMPSKIKATTRFDDQYIKDTVYISEISVNKAISSDIFLFKKPKNVKQFESSEKRK